MFDAVIEDIGEGVPGGFPQAILYTVPAGLEFAGLFNISIKLLAAAHKVYVPPL